MKYMCKNTYASALTQVPGGITGATGKNEQVSQEVLG